MPPVPQTWGIINDTEYLGMHPASSSLGIIMLYVMLLYATISNKYVPFYMTKHWTTPFHTAAYFISQHVSYQTVCAIVAEFCIVGTTEELTTTDDDDDDDTTSEASETVSHISDAVILFSLSLLLSLSVSPCRNSYSNISNYTTIQLHCYLNLAYIKIVNYVLLTVYN